MGRVEAAANSINQFRVLERGRRTVVTSFSGGCEYLSVSKYSYVYVNIQYVLSIYFIFTHYLSITMCLVYEKVKDFLYIHLSFSSLKIILQFFFNTIYLINPGQESKPLKHLKVSCPSTNVGQKQKYNAPQMRLK